VLHKILISDRMVRIIDTILQKKAHSGYAAGKGKIPRKFEKKYLKRLFYE